MALPLVAIDVLLIVLWTIAAALAIAFIMTKLSTILDGVPWVGGKLSSAVKAMAQAISDACGVLWSGIESVVGAGFHLFATYLHSLLNQFVTHAALIAHLAQIAGNAIYDVSGIRALVRGLTSVVHVVLHRFVAIGREVFHLAQRVKTLEQDFSKGIGADVLPRIKALEREVANVEGQVLPSIESAETALANDITNLGEYIRANFLSSATDAVTAAVALALAALGLGGLRCNSLLNSLKNRGCGFWGDLESLLGLFADTLLLLNVCEIIPFLETAVSDVADPIVVTLTDVGAGLCSGGIGAPPTLAVPALSLPANPGFTLNLP